MTIDTSLLAESDHRRVGRGRRVQPVIGARYGRLVVTGEAPTRGGVRYWLCRCDCGAGTVCRVSHVISGDTRSCGCLSVEVHTRHGFTPRRAAWHPLYHTWASMHGRCERTTRQDFKYYGGRGITVCERWSGPEGFANFLADMGEKPGPDYSIDRIDNDGLYSPENCRWSTKSEQSANQQPRQRRKR